MLKRLIPVGVVAALALGLSACGGGSESPSGAAPSVSADAALAAKVPDSVKSDGKILVGTDATYPPNESLAADGKTVQGWDVDLFKAVAAKLGLQAEFQPATFGDIIPGVGSGKYEVGVSSFTINPERVKQALMVSYYNAGTQWATKKGNPAGIDPNNPCGKRVAVQRDTVQAEDIAKKNDACKAAGKPEITIEPYPGQDAAAAAVVSGKDDAMLADSPVAAYAVKQSNGQLELLGDIYDAAPYGYVVPKEQQQFAEAVQGAVDALIKDGTYQKILDQWGVAGGAVPSSQINP
ncbi:ABC transporter substrate-binding protein [Catellatospora sp. TT07R-123]|uniref:ABC transporter substrate-binding protein n=1 Tax=Catellatospora sp. TT07R-123 TaxID=2733863 RepID=UPI001B173DB0|nr:ABC transporter substrate-binding protein [Catellatospora sp. TT07R-123]GHJ44880.1 ABC transporter substrate-binding protein [Catellatospora sp. TT07R-123]